MSSPSTSHRRSSEGADDVCPICLCPMDEGFSRPENCQHRFDLDCLTEWSKLRLSCPSCRAGFGAIYTYEIVERKPKLVKVQKMEQPKEEEPFDEANPLDFTFCEICGGGQHEELLLICDQCDKGFHTYCLTPPLDGVPASEQWFCPRCEEARNSLPSTSRRLAPSARAIRLVQRTALAERVRRVLQRSRRILVESEETSESESADEEDEEEEEEDGELVEEDEDVEGEESSEEDEVQEFFDDDARVLAEIGDDDEVTLPSVQRRSKKQREAAAKKKKTTKAKKTKKKTPRKATKRRKRKTKGRRRTRKQRPADTKEGPLDAFVTRRGGTHDPVARLTLLGAELEPVADDLYDGESSSLITENSRRFDRPLLPRKDGRNDRLTPFKDEAVEEEKPAADSCDLLGSIIPEQVKTLAPGRLFAIGGGRFNTTDDFEKYKERKTNQLSSELRERLGIPVERDDVFEGRSDANRSRDKVKEKNASVKPDEPRNIFSTSSLSQNRSVESTNSRDLMFGRGRTSRDTGKDVEQRSVRESNNASASRGGEQKYSRRGDRSHDYRANDSRGRREERSPERPREDKNWRNIERNEPRDESRKRDRADGKRGDYDQPRGVIRQYGTTVRSELDPPGKVHNFGSSGRNSHERQRETHRLGHSIESGSSRLGEIDRSDRSKRESPRSQGANRSDRTFEKDLLRPRETNWSDPFVEKNSPIPREANRSDRVVEKDFRPRESDWSGPFVRKNSPVPREANRSDRGVEKGLPRHGETSRSHLYVGKNPPGPREANHSDLFVERDSQRVREANRQDRLVGETSPGLQEDRANRDVKKESPRYGDAAGRSRHERPQKDGQTSTSYNFVSGRQEGRAARRKDDKGSHDRSREVSVQTSPVKAIKREPKDGKDVEKRDLIRSEQLIDEICKNTHDYAHSRYAVTDHHHEHSTAHSEKPVSIKAPKIEESEQEDKGSTSRALSTGNEAEGAHNQVEKVWMPSLPGSSAHTVMISSNSASSSARNDEKNSDDRVKIIEGFAKDAIKQYKREITVEQYKDVMRAVVRDCYKRRILDEVKIKSKVDECVRAVRNGEQLDTGHHSSKRPETSGDRSAIPAKRQKVNI